MAYREFYVDNATGSDVNGGSSQSVIYTETDTSIDDITNAAKIWDDGLGDPWAGVAVGDVLCFDTAVTKQYRRVTSIADVGIDGSINVTPNMVGVLGGKTTNVGGAWDTIQNAADLVGVAAGAIGGDGNPPRVNIKSGTAYTEQVNIDTNAGTYALPITFQGYTTTVGDGGQAEINADTLGGTGAVYINAKNYIRLMDLYVHTSDAGVEAINVTASSEFCEFRNLHLKATGAGAGGLLIPTKARLINVWVEDTGSGVADGFTTGSSCVLVGCRSTSAIRYGFNVGEHCVCINCISDGSGDDGFFLARYSNGILGCVSYGSTAGSGIRSDQTSLGYIPPIVNCILEGNNQYGIELDEATEQIYEDFNAFYNNAQGEVNANLINQGGNDVTLTGSAFTNAATGNFTLNNTAGAGAACRNAGFPGTLLDATNIGYADIGALRHQDPAGGSGGLLMANKRGNKQ